MKKKLNIAKDFETITNEGDVAKLLLAVQGISLQMEIGISVYNTLDEAKKIYYNYEQGGEESNAIRMIF